MHIADEKGNKKKRQAEIRKKIQEDYQKNRDPIKEFFQLVSKLSPSAAAWLSTTFSSDLTNFYLSLFIASDLSIGENKQSTYEPYSPY